MSFCFLTLEKNETIRSCGNDNSVNRIQNKNQKVLGKIV